MPANRLALVLPTGDNDMPYDLPAKPSLEQAQKIVGGYIEVVKGYFEGRACQVLCDEEGNRKGLPLNELATLICKRGIVGTVIVLQGWRF